MRILIKFIMCETENERRILDVLVERIGSPSRVRFESFIVLYRWLCVFSAEPCIIRTISNITGSALRRSDGGACIEVSLKMKSEMGCKRWRFRYFLPCTHTMPSQTARVRDDSFYQKSAERLLQLVPQCIVVNPNELYSPESLHGYLSESRRLVQGTLEGCSCWALPYDGMSPDPKLFREQQNSDEESSSQVCFG